MSRVYTRAHEPMLIEWLTKNYPPGSWTSNVRLGAPDPQLQAVATTPEERRMLMIALHTCDAVVLTTDKVTIVEVATEPKVEKVCQCELYGHLFRETEQFKAHWNKPIDLIILSTVESDLIRWFAEKHGVRWVVYVPLWWEAHIRTRQARKFTAPGVQAPGGAEVRT